VATPARPTAAKLNVLPVNHLPVFAATIPDLLRLLVVPVFGWAAIRDIKTRRVPNRTWLPLAALGLVLLAWDAVAVWNGTATRLMIDGLSVSLQSTVTQPLSAFLLRTAISVAFVVAFAYGFWLLGGFGGADAKALMTLAVVFPLYPEFLFEGFTLPWFETTVGVFSLTILSNTVLAGAGYPLVLAARNAAGGDVSRLMVIGDRAPADSLTERYGRLLERPDGYTRGGLDLDVLRMYLTWRGCSLADLRDDPDHYRTSVPEDPADPGGGTVAESLPLPEGDSEGDRTPEEDDPWGAEAFFADIGGPIYGTDTEDLRDGLNVIAGGDRVWYSPGIPFIVPMFGGLLLSLLAGDVLVWGLAVVGLG